MKIVVLDGSTLNPGDLSWDLLGELGELRVFSDTRPAEVVTRASNADVVLTNKVVLDDDVLGELNELRLICVIATGFDVVDIDAARRRSVTVCNVPSYATSAVAQHVFALLLHLTNHVSLHDHAVRDGAWVNRGGFTFWDAPMIELAGRTLGVVGYGRIGQAVGRIAEALGMQVHTVNSNATESEVTKLFASSDVVSLHCPLTEATHHLVGARRLAAMPHGGFLINTSRGGLVDNAALVAALRSGRLAGAGLDVVDGEPIDGTHPLLDVPNLVVTPHNAWTCLASRQRLLDECVENVRSFQGGTPRNVVL